MRLFATMENGKLGLTNDVTDAYFFSGKVRQVKDYTLDDIYNYVAIRKGDKFAIFSEDEYNQMFGNQVMNFDDEVRLCIA